MPRPGGFLGSLLQAYHPRPFVDLVDGVELDVVEHAAGRQPDALPLDAVDGADVLAVGALHFHLFLDLRRINHDRDLLRTCRPPALPDCNDSLAPLFQAAAQGPSRGPAEPVGQAADARKFDRGGAYRMPGVAGATQELDATGPRGPRP